MVSTRTGHDVRWLAQAGSARDPAVREILQKPLTAKSAVQLALLNNAGLQAAFEELGVARSELVRAVRLPNPTLEAGLGFHSDGHTRPELELGAFLDLTELMFLPLRHGAGRARLEAAQLSVAGRVLDLALETRTAFYRYQASLQTLELDRTVVQALRASLEAAERLHEAGNITDLRLANERALYEEARLDLARAELLMGAQRQELGALLGLWQPDVSWVAEARLPALPPDAARVPELEARSIEQSLDLQLLRHRYEAAARSANLATARGWVPRLEAGVHASREHEGERTWAIGPALAIELPLFYQGQGETDGALSDLRRQAQLQIDTAVRIRARARNLAARLRAAAQSVEHYERVLLPLREQIVNGSQLEYNAMSAGVFQLLEAKRAQIAAGRSYVEQLRDYWIMRAEADQLLAGRLPGAGMATSLEEPAPRESGERSSAAH